jgi:hypothetical protein
MNEATSDVAPTPATITHTLTPQGLFAQFEREGFCLRSPVADITGLHRATATGDCLEPLIVAGDLMYIDMHAAPQHGDLVLFQWSEAVQESWRKDARRPEWIAKHGNADFSRGIKLYWQYPILDWLPPEYYLLTNTDLREAKDHKILGVVRAIERNGELLMGDIVRRTVAAASIDPNAVSTIGSAQSSTLVACQGVNHAVQSTAVISLSVLTTGAPTEIDVNTSVLVTTGGSAGLTTGLMQIFRDGSAVAGAEWDATGGGTISVFNSQFAPIPITLVVTDNPGAGSHTYTLQATVRWDVVTGSGSAAFSCTNNFIKVREIKK